MQTLAVDDVTFSIEAGEIFGVIGYSGAGKSTLVRLINQLERLSDGEIVVLDQSVGNLNEQQLKNLRSEIGMIFQGFNLFNAKTIAQNVEFPLKVAGWDKDKRKERVAELLEFVGLSEKATAYPGQLSGGQKQRVGIARALATNPKILLADEATSALDPETTLDVLRLLKRINQELKVTIVVITHTMSIIRLLCNRVAIMNFGKIAEIGSVQSVFDSPQSEVGRRFVETFKTMDTGILEAQ
jgi:D-methionine transport system ATP-binding protein